MSQVVREIRVPPDPVGIARALAGAAHATDGLAVLHGDGRGALGPADARFSFVACAPVETSDAWVPPAGRTPKTVDTHGWAGFGAAPRWIGVIPYEATRALERPAWTRAPDDRAPPSLLIPRWQRYDAVVRIDRASGAVVLEADDASAAARLEGKLRAPWPLARPVTLCPKAREPDSAHVARIREILRLIAKGDVYQVNAARRIGFTVSGSPLDVFSRLFKASPAPYGFFADFHDVTVCATSPELALEVRGDRLRTAPIKGTRPRGPDAASDAALARELDADTKERAELTMAVDLHRNDLGRVAVPGSVRVLGVPRVLGGRTVWSRVAEVVARRAPDTDLEAILRAVLPCGSVTGAPKVRAMEIIATLEPFRRGLYTGAFGYLGRDGALVLAMAIRTLEIQGDIAQYWTGGGIVADSDPLRELEETHWKAVQLASL